MDTRCLTRVTHEKLVKGSTVNAPLYWGGVELFNGIAPWFLPESCSVSGDQSVSHSSVLFGTLLNSTLVS